MSTLLNTKTIALLSVCVASTPLLFSSEAPHSPRLSARATLASALSDSTPMSLGTERSYGDLDFLGSAGSLSVGRLLELESASHSHITDEDNLGLARIFVNSRANEYSYGAYSDAVSAFEGTSFSSVVKAIEARSSCLPGMKELCFAKDESTIEEAVRMFAKGATTLYVYTMALGGDSGGEYLKHVWDHIRGEKAFLNSTVKEHMPMVVIHCLKEEATQFRRRLSHLETDADKRLTAFWSAINDLVGDDLAYIPEECFSSEDQASAYRVMREYQKYRVQRYQQNYKNDCRIAQQGAVSNWEQMAAKLSETRVLDNGWA